MKSFSSFKESRPVGDDVTPLKPVREKKVVAERDRPQGLGFSEFAVDLFEAPIDTPDYNDDDESFALDVLSKIDDGISSIESAIELDNRKGNQIVISLAYSLLWKVINVSNGQR